MTAVRLPLVEMSPSPKPTTRTSRADRAVRPGAYAHRPGGAALGRGHHRGIDERCQLFGNRLHPARGVGGRRKLTPQRAGRRASRGGRQVEARRAAARLRHGPATHGIPTREPGARRGHRPTRAGRTRRGRRTEGRVACTVILEEGVADVSGRGGKDSGSPPALRPRRHLPRPPGRRSSGGSRGGDQRWLPDGPEPGSTDVRGARSSTGGRGEGRGHGRLLARREPGRRPSRTRASAQAGCALWWQDPGGRSASADIPVRLRARCAGARRNRAERAADCAADRWNLTG
ncbi:hypothetical protein SAMN05216574_107107 [Blastococcus tunisiensis]|uniref:Uncharacterized protein n=1 Tax=Blastococcus tunisiensis TaxID=1798228 RepID=A0A1I2EN79_9ACTN|nr:hypothetical protein SAMN05216574_107107 [Blastococcus sp. DSM 46838]